MKKIVVYAPDEVRDELDRAILDTRVSSGQYMSRSDVVVAIIESVDLSRFVSKMAKDRK